MTYLIDAFLPVWEQQSSVFQAEITRLQGILEQYQTQSENRTNKSIRLKRVAHLESQIQALQDVKNSLILMQGRLEPFIPAKED